MSENSIKRQTISGLVFRFGERITAQLVSTIITIILARILMPDDYGIVALVNIMITILNVFVESGLGTALVQKKDADQTDFSTVFWSSIVISIVIYGGLYALSPLIASNYDKSELTPLLRVMGLRLPIAAINSVQHAYISKKLAFRKFFFATLTGTVVSGVVGVVMAYVGYGPWALAFQYLTNVFVDTVFLWYVVKWRPTAVFSIQRFKTLFSFGWKILISGLLSSVYEELRSFLIAGKYSTADLSYYTKGQQFPNLFASNVGTTITNVMFPVLSVYQTDNKKLKKAVRRSITICSYVMFPILFGFAAIAESFVVVLLTEKWLPCVPYIYLFCIFYMFKPLKTLNQSCLKAMGKSTCYLVFNLVEKAIGIILILFTVNAGVLYLAVSAVATYAIAAIMEMTANSVYLKYTLREQLKDIIRPVCMSILIFIPVYLLDYSGLNVYLVLPTQIVLGIALYLLLSVVFRVEEFTYIKELIKTYLPKKRKQN